MKKWWWLLSLSSANAFAFTPSLQTIVEQLAKNCIVGSADLEATKRVKDETIFLSLKLKEDGLFIAKNNRDTKEEGRISLFFLSNLFNCPKSNNDVTHFKNYLANNGIDINKISHYLFENEPVFIIGASPEDLSSPQLWIEKKDFLPVKEIVKKRTTIFNKWTSINSLGNKKFPSLITTTEENQVTSIATAEKKSFSSGG